MPKSAEKLTDLESISIVEMFENDTICKTKEIPLRFNLQYGKKYSYSFLKKEYLKITSMNKKRENNAINSDSNLTATSNNKEIIRSKRKKINTELDDDSSKKQKLNEISEKGDSDKNSNEEDLILKQ